MELTSDHESWTSGCTCSAPRCLLWKALTRSLEMRRTVVAPTWVAATGRVSSLSLSTSVPTQGRHGVTQCAGGHSRPHPAGISEGPPSPADVVLELAGAIAAVAASQDGFDAGEATHAQRAAPVLLEFVLTRSRCTGAYATACMNSELQLLEMTSQRSHRGFKLSAAW